MEGELSRIEELLFAYVANRNSNTVSVINTGTNTIVDTVPGLSDPREIAITPDGSRAYVANISNATVSVINTANNTVVATLSVGFGPAGIAITPILLF
jgi:YVTN family beta-propeller protein